MCGKTSRVYGVKTLKRLFDITLSSVVIVLVLLPVMLLVAVILRVLSPGPVFYRSPRYGQNGNIFKAYKFRSMVMNADKYLKSHSPELHERFIREAKLPIDEDPRIVKGLKWLRRYSLDELPQAINILKGEMSFVGPRPKLLFEKEKYNGQFDEVVSVPQGLTGWWQVNGRNDTSYNERIALDLWYVQNYSFGLDLKIILKTVGVVVTGKGAN